MQILLDCVHFSRPYFPITSPSSMTSWKLSVQISEPMGCIVHTFISTVSCRFAKRNEVRPFSRKVSA